MGRAGGVDDRSEGLDDLDHAPMAMTVRHTKARSSDDAALGACVVREP
jgi:hypothetical protein